MSRNHLVENKILSYPPRQNDQIPLLVPRAPVLPLDRLQRHFERRPGSSPRCEGATDADSASPVLAEIASFPHSTRQRHQDREDQTSDLLAETVWTQFRKMKIEGIDS
eukprot:3688657-Rhodomonas_salina.1